MGSRTLRWWAISELAAAKKYQNVPDPENTDPLRETRDTREMGSGAFGNP